MKLQPEAADQFLRAERVNRKGKELELPDDTARLEGARRPARRRRQAALAAGDAGDRRDERRPSRRDPAWVYWKARALQALAKDSQEGEALQTQQPASCSTGIAAQLNFYGQLAAEDLGQPQTLPPKPAPLTPAEREAVAAPSRLRARAGADLDRPAQRRRARMELLACAA